ncbi:hypothetical protein PV326_001685 [Microctonus aethiopoides]|nr:hypothetical protein PV326_001685 [Microctonus aethiopoides]
MSVLEDRELYKNNTYFTKHEYGDFTPEYWQDRHTGNRWIQSMWVVTPHKNPPLDLSELKPATIQTAYIPHYPTSEAGDAESSYPDSRLNTPLPQEYMELHKRETSVCLTLFVVGVIMILLKYGSFIFGRRQPYHTYAYTVEELGTVAYERDVSYSETVA